MAASCIGSELWGAREEAGLSAWKTKRRNPAIKMRRLLLFFRAAISEVPGTE
jgi:hypothetical protein